MLGQHAGINGNVLSKNPVVAIGQAYTDSSAWFASANKEYLTLASNATIQTGDIDYEFADWLRFDSVGTSDWIVGKVDEWKIDLSSSILRFGTYASSTWTYVSASTFGALSTATWYFVRVWRDKTAGTINISVNGTTNSASASANTAGAGDMVWGKGTSYYNGRMDSASWRKVLSNTSEASQLYNGGLGLTSTLVQQYMPTWWTNTISWWDFDELDGIRYDKKGTNHLTATADPIIAPPVYGPELIVNGGFETAGSGGADVFGSWTEYVTDGAIADETTIVHSGGHAAKLTDGITSNTTYMTNTFAVTAGANYYYSFWSRGSGNGRYGIVNVTHNADIVSTSVTNNKTTTYQLFTGQFTAPAGCTSVKIILYSPYSAGGIAYFDDVSVKEITTASINNGGFDLRPATGGEKTNVSTVSRSRTSNVATMVATAHGLKNNDVVTITGMTDTTFNGTNKTVTVVDVDTFTYSSTGSDAGSAGDTGGRIATDVFSSWTEVCEGLSNISAETAAPYSGSYSAKLYVDAAGSASQVNIPSMCIVGKRYSVSLYAKTSSAGSSIRVFNGSTTARDFALTTSYANYTSNWTADGTTFYISRYAGTTTSIYIDQVTLTSLGPTSDAGIASGLALNTNNVSKLFNTGSAGSQFAQITLAKRPVYSTSYFGGCLLFDGVDDSLVISGDKIGTGDVTICAVIRPTGWGGLNAGRIIDNGQIIFAVEENRRARLYSNASAVNVAYSSFGSITLNTSYIVTVTRTSAGIVDFYINGKLSGTANQNSGTPVAGSDTYIGNRAAGDRAFDGYIGKVGVINRILSLGEIQAVSRRLSIEAGGIY